MDALVDTAESTSGSEGHRVSVTLATASQAMSVLMEEHELETLIRSAVRRGRAGARGRPRSVIYRSCGRSPPGTRGRGESFEDLVQVGSIGLVLALKRFDPERGVAFKSFAIPTIVGEIRRHFRDRAWALHVPRRFKELSLR